jgi:hypothetical protein
MSSENAAEAHRKRGNSSTQRRRKIDVAHSQHTSTASAKALFFFKWQRETDGEPFGAGIS